MKFLLVLMVACMIVSCAPYHGSAENGNREQSAKKEVKKPVRSGQEGDVYSY